MALPNPIPDNPTRWEGWREYNSDDLYKRLCLSYESNPSPDQIEENCRQLLIWWQKKLPLKSQPSNPLSQMLRAGMDEAPAYLAEARTKLLDAEGRAKFDLLLHSQIVLEALGEFKKLLAFALGENKLREEDEQRLYERGRGLGLTRDDMRAAVEEELARLGAQRVAAAVFVAPAAVVSAPSGSSAEGRDPATEFRRMLRLSKLALEGEEMTDDQRDALCNMGESLGLTGGEAEDLIDEYLEEASGLPPLPMTPLRAAPPPVKKPEPAPAAPVAKEPAFNPTPLARAQERQDFPNYASSQTGIQMLLVPSGAFSMGGVDRDAAPHEQPVSPVTLGCFYLARFPVTNAQYEKFDAAHGTKRAPWADEKHPVVYVTSKEAEKFCQWLSAKEGRKYRLPSEAEWEYAARGAEPRIFPWGDKLDGGHLANFADKRTSFAWRDTVIDDGFAETAPIGSYPRGASPFGIEDMAGNVFEWCGDFFEPYRGRERHNPRSATTNTKRIYRGGSWKSRAVNLRTTARNFNLPDYSSNDVGFRIVCECECEG